MKEERIVNLIECFRSFQGEGVDSGRTMYILRFKTCNLKCHYCDTQVKMRISVEAPYKISEIQKRIIRDRASILISGGEPTIPRHFDEALMLLNELNYDLANVESNGFDLENLVKQTDASKNVKFMYSPKIFTDKDLKEAMEKSKQLFKYDRVYFKIVWQDGFTDAYCQWLSKEVDGSDAENRIWLMPQGITRAELIKNSETVFDLCEKYKFSFSSRDHIIYGFV